MPSGRVDQASALLANGDILVTGGATAHGTAPVRQVEIFSLTPGSVAGASRVSTVLVIVTLALAIALAATIFSRMSRAI
jgi:hypothetical protein